MIGDGLILDGCPNALVSEERYFRHFFDFRTKDVKLQGSSWEGWLDLGLDKARADCTHCTPPLLAFSLAD